MANRASGRTFSTTWKTDTFADMGSHAVAGALALTSDDTGSIKGGSSQGVLVADGVNVPTFDGAAHPNYANVNNMNNFIYLVRAGDSVHWIVQAT